MENSTIRVFHRLSGKRDSNPRPSAWEADALPTELLPQYGWSSCQHLASSDAMSEMFLCPPLRQASALLMTSVTLSPS